MHCWYSFMRLSEMGGMIHNNSLICIFFLCWFFLHWNVPSNLPPPKSVNTFHNPPSWLVEQKQTTRSYLSMFPRVYFISKTFKSHTHTVNFEPHHASDKIRTDLKHTEIHHKCCRTWNLSYRRETDECCTQLRYQAGYRTQIPPNTSPVHTTYIFK